MDDRLNVDASVEELLAERGGAERTSRHHRHDRLAHARADIETGHAGALRETLRVGFEPRDPFGLRSQEFERRERRSCDRGRHGDAVDEAPRRSLEEIDQRLRAGDKPAAGGKRFRQGSHPNVDPPRIDAEMFKHPLPAWTQHAQAMGVVDHQPCLTAFLDVDQRRQVADIAVHAVKSLGDDQNPVVLVPDARQGGVERLDVVMREGAALAPRHHRAHDDAVMRESVVQHEVSWSEQRRDGGDVGRVPAYIGQTAALPVMVRQRGLEFGMDGPLAGHKPACRGGNAIAIDGSLRGAPDRRAVVEPEIVIRGKVDERLALDDGRRPGVGGVNEKIGVAKSQARSG
jgi:hypothetical protein